MHIIIQNCFNVAIYSNRKIYSYQAIEMSQSDS